MKLYSVLRKVYLYRGAYLIYIMMYLSLDYRTLDRSHPALYLQGQPEPIYRSLRSIAEHLATSETSMLGSNWTIFKLRAGSYVKLRKYLRMRCTFDPTQRLKYEYMYAGGYGRRLSGGTQSWRRMGTMPMRLRQRATPSPPMTSRSTMRQPMRAMGAPKRGER
jgi:hypothetical protein